MNNFQEIVWNQMMESLNYRDAFFYLCGRTLHSHKDCKNIVKEIKRCFNIEVYRKAPELDCAPGQLPLFDKEQSITPLSEETVKKLLEGEAH